MRIHTYRHLLFFIFCSVYTFSAAQVEDIRKSESEIKIEDKFVEAYVLVASGKRKDAIKLLDTIRRESAPNAAIYFELAKLNYQEKDLNQTETNLKSAINLEPDNIWIRQFEIQFSKDLGRFDEAISSLRHLVALQPKNSEHYDELVDLLVKTNQTDAALVTLINKENSVGTNTYTTLKKAEILDKAGRLDESIKEINLLVNKFPQEKKYLRLIVNMLHSNDQIAKSEPYLKKILEIDQDDNDAKLGLILLNKKGINDNDFLVTLIPLIKNPDAPIDMKIKELLPFVEKHAESGDSTLGRQLTNICDQLVIAHPNEAKAHAIYGDILKNDNKLTSAIRQYEKTLQLNNKNFMVWEQLMYCLDNVENYVELESMSIEAIDYFPNQAMSYYFAAKALIQRKENKKAMSFIDEARLISAGNPNILSRAFTLEASIFLSDKNFKKSNEILDEAIRISGGKNADAYELKGDIFRHQNDLKNAGLEWKKAFDLGGNTTRLTQKMNSIKGD